MLTRANVNLPSKRDPIRRGAMHGRAGAASSLLFAAAMGMTLVAAPAYATEETAKSDREDAAELANGTAFQQEETVADPGASLLGSYLAGRFARSSREMDRAAAFFRDALERDPANEDILRDAFFSEASIGNWDQVSAYARKMAEGSDNHWLAHAFLGIEAFRAKDLELAATQFQLADAGPVGELTSRLARAWLKLSGGTPEEAIVATDEVTQTWARSYRNYHRALMADLAGLDAEAKRTFASIFEEEPRTTRVALAYARHLASRGNYEEARGVLRTHVRAAASRDPQVDALLARLADGEADGEQVKPLVTMPAQGLGELFYEVGNTLATQGDIEAGTIYLQMALYVSPGMDAAHFALAGVHDATKHHERAMDTYGRIPATSPLSFDAKLRRAYSLNSLKRLDQAQAELDILATKLANEADAARKHANVIIQATGEAIPVSYRDLPTGEAGVRLAQELLTELGFNPGEIDGQDGPATRRALVAFQEILGLEADGAIGPQSLRALLAETAPGGPLSVRDRRLRVLLVLGTLMRANEQFDVGLGYYDRAVALIDRPQPQDWRYFYHRGVCLERLKRWPEAEKDLEKALELNPDQPQVLNYLGYTWVDRNENLDLGLEYIRKAVRLRPNDGYIVDSLGWAYYRLGNFKSAVRYLERAVELQPEDPTINDHLGDAYWQVGRKLEARYQWQQSLELKPEAEFAAATRDKLIRGLVAPDATRVVQDATTEANDSPTAEADDAVADEDASAPAVVD